MAARDLSQGGDMHRQLVGIAVSLVLLPVSVAAQSIQTDYDRSYDFSRLKTYAFAKQTRGPNDPLAANPINDRRVHMAIDSQLVAHGYIKDTTGAPDFFVGYHAATRSRLAVQDWGYGPGRWGSRRVDINEYTEGTLVVDVVEAKSMQLMWRGSATGTVKPKDAEKNIPKAVGKLMDQFAKDVKPKKS